MPKFTLQIADLVPKETTFVLSTRPGETFTLSRWSLRVRTWATKEFGGAERLREIFQQQQIEEIAAIAWFMVKEKEAFKNVRDNFLDDISTMQDQINVVMALLGAVGIGEPEIEQLKEDLGKKKLTPEVVPTETPTIGEKSLTP